MKNHFREIAACSSCHGELQWADSAVTCNRCGFAYPVVNGIPCMLLDEKGEPAGFPPPRPPIPGSALRRFLSRATSIPKFAYKTNRSAMRIPRMVESLPPDAVVLNVGSGSTSYGPRVINLEIGPLPNVDVVASGETLPVKDSSVDAIITQGVLEHVCDLAAALKEIDRVTRPGGIIYHEVPFIQGFHGSPTDFVRFTHMGVSDLGAGYTIEDSGVAVGPSSAAGWLLTEWLSLLFSFGNNKLYRLARRGFGWLLFPIKFADRFLEGRAEAGMIASAFYIRCRKPAE